MRQANEAQLSCSTCYASYRYPSHTAPETVRVSNELHPSEGEEDEDWYAEVVGDRVDKVREKELGEEGGEDIE